jgi:hypothetical protein
MSSLSVWLPTFDSYCLQYADLNFDELWQTLQLFIKEESMEKIDEVTQIMSILIVLSMETMHLTFVSFSLNFI